MLGWEDSLEKGMEPTPVFLLGESHGVTNQTQLSNLHYYYYSDDKRGLPRWCMVKNPPPSAGDTGDESLIPVSDDPLE